MLLLKYNIMCSARHIQGTKNVITDALSRLDVSKALYIRLQEGRTPSTMHIPACLRPTNWSWS